MCPSNRHARAPAFCPHRLPTRRRRSQSCATQPLAGRGESPLPATLSVCPSRAASISAGSRPMPSSSRRSWWSSRVEGRRRSRRRPFAPDVLTGVPRTVRGVPGVIRPGCLHRGPALVTGQGPTLFVGSSQRKQAAPPFAPAPEQAGQTPIGAPPAGRRSPAWFPGGQPKIAEGPAVGRSPRMSLPGSPVVGGAFFAGRLGRG